MALSFTAPRVSSRRRFNRETNKWETTWQVCVTITNDGDADVDTCVTIYQQDRYNPPPGVVITTECTVDVTVPKRREIRDAAGNLIIAADGTEVICCELNGEPLSGQEYVAVGGTTKDKAGDVVFGGTGNFSSPTGTYNRPKRVGMLPGEKLQFAALMGVNFIGVKKAQIDGALKLPDGWEIDFPEDLSAGPYPVEVHFTLKAPQLVKAGDTARVTLRAHDKANASAGVEETTIEFAIKGDDDDAGIHPCCER